MSSNPLLLIAVLTLSVAVANADWPQFRGPDGQGVVTQAAIPLKWSESDHVTWKTEIAGRGWSSPVVLGEEIWLTTAVEQEPTPEQIEKQFAESGLDEKQFTRRQVAGSISLRAVCVHRASGKVIRDFELFRAESPEAIHTANSYASPTPVIEPGRLYCHFGMNGTACVDTNTGEILWAQSIPLFYSVGAGSSPVVYENLLVLVCDGVDEQFIIALSKSDGKEVWRTPRPPFRTDDGQQRKAYSTPLLVKSDGRDQLIIPGAQWVVSYDPATGEEIWRVDHGSGFSNVPRPIYGHGMVYICTGFGKPELWAIRVDGEGDVTDTHVAWASKGQISAKPSPVLVGDLIFVVSDTGIASCFDAHTGKELWKERLGGNYSSSLLAAGERVYFFSEEGETTVIKTAPEYVELAKSQVDGKLMASPAVIDSALLLRSDATLYRIE